MSWRKIAANEGEFGTVSSSEFLKSCHGDLWKGTVASREWHHGVSWESLWALTRDSSGNIHAASLSTHGCLVILTVWNLTQVLPLSSCDVCYLCPFFTARMHFLSWPLARRPRLDPCDKKMPLSVSGRMTLLGEISLVLFGSITPREHIDVFNSLTGVQGLGP